MAANRNRDRSKRVFLNVPYDDSYEKILVALTAALVSIGRVPQLTFEVPDRGDGRLKRIFGLLNSCRVSIHDLSAVEKSPVRFNMPFELGLACAIKTQSRDHDFLVLERKPHRLDVTLSDLRGIDPKIHNGKPGDAICAVLETLVRRGGNPTTEAVLKVYDQMWKLLPALKKRHGRGLFSKLVYGELVALGYEIAAATLPPHRPKIGRK